MNRPLALVLTVLTLVAATSAQSRRRALTHDDYDRWPQVSGAAYSADGKWLAYSVNPAWGDGELHLQEVDGTVHHTHPRGSAPRFSEDGRLVVFGIKESVVDKRREDLEKLHGGAAKELEAQAKKKAAQEQARRGQRGSRRGGRSAASKGELAIMDVATGDVSVLGKVKTHRVTRHGRFVVYQPELAEKKVEAKKKTDTEEAPQRERKTAAAEAAKRSNRGRRSRSGGQKKDEGGPLVIRNLQTGEETRYANVTAQQMIAEDAWLCVSIAAAAEASEAAAKPGESDAENTEVDVAAASPPGTVLEAGLHAIELASGRRVHLVEGAATYAGFATDKRHHKLAFTSDTVEQRARAARERAAEPAAKSPAKSASEAPQKTGGKGEAADPEDDAKDDADDDDARFDVYLWDFGATAAQRAVSADSEGLPADSRIQSGGLSFSADGSVLVFGIKDAPPPDLPKILPEEKVVVDIWHWQDGMIQPMQAKQARSKRNPTRTCVLHLDGRRVLALGNHRVPAVALITPDGSRGLATDSEPYEKLITWDGRYSDVYLVNTVDGSRRRILGKHRGRAQASPAGRWVLYFGVDSHWYAIDVESGDEHCLTADLGVRFENELEDRPQPASAYGIAGWTAEDREVLLYDRWDVWKIEPATGAATCVTDGYGRANRTVLRVTRFDLEGDDDDLDPLQRAYLPAALLLSARDHRSKAQGYFLDSTIGTGKPRKLVMRDAAFGRLARARKAERTFFTLSTFAEYPDIWTADLSFDGMRKLTDACPMQREVRWGKAELVKWINADGRELAGYLIKPDGFDPSRKYPMMVYFYERNADNLHRYSRPQPGTSPNPAYYVSNGYLWFVPDIVYTVGYPGESAEKCVISGVQHLIAQGFVDRDAIGCAGHSWGGYQTAHLITRTNLFAAAESGAPVSNMFSAYGGIRYGSGASRQFQYERTQSRIGGTPWQYPQRYWQNSPLFYADRVQTPCLILHNDKDGAVPWTNGVELFMALRRLGKEAYLFNYNGEDHGLRKRQNQKDWTRRMAGFFDHHLKGAPAPQWMTEGVRYIEREREKIRYAPSYVEASAAGQVDPQVRQAVEGAPATGGGTNGASRQR